MKNTYRIKVGDWTSKEEYSNYEARKIRSKLQDCFVQKVQKVKVE